MREKEMATYLMSKQSPILTESQFMEGIGGTSTQTYDLSSQSPINASYDQIQMVRNDLAMSDCSSSVSSSTFDSSTSEQEGNRELESAAVHTCSEMKKDSSWTTADYIELFDINSGSESTEDIFNASTQEFVPPYQSQTEDHNEVEIIYESKFIEKNSEDVLSPAPIFDPTSLNKIKIIESQLINTDVLINKGKVNIWDDLALSESDGSQNEYQQFSVTSTTPQNSSSKRLSSSCKFSESGHHKRSKADIQQSDCSLEVDGMATKQRYPSGSVSSTTITVRHPTEGDHLKCSKSDDKEEQRPAVVYTSSEMKMDANLTIAKYKELDLITKSKSILDIFNVSTQEFFFPKENYDAEIINESQAIDNVLPSAQVSVFSPRLQTISNHEVADIPESEFTDEMLTPTQVFDPPTRLQTMSNHEVADIPESEFKEEMLTPMQGLVPPTRLQSMSNHEVAFKEEMLTPTQAFVPPTRLQTISNHEVADIPPPESRTKSTHEENQKIHKDPTYMKNFLVSARKFQEKVHYYKTATIAIKVKEQKAIDELNESTRKLQLIQDEAAALKLKSLEYPSMDLFLENVADYIDVRGCLFNEMSPPLPPPPLTPTSKSGKIYILPQAVMSLSQPQSPISSIEKQPIQSQAAMAPPSTPASKSEKLPILPAPDSGSTAIPSIVNSNSADRPMTISVTTKDIFSPLVSQIPQDTVHMETGPDDRTPRWKLPCVSNKKKVATSWRAVPPSNDSVTVSTLGSQTKQRVEPLRIVKVFPDNKSQCQAANVAARRISSKSSLSTKRSNPILPKPILDANPKVFAANVGVQKKRKRPLSDTPMQKKVLKEKTACQIDSNTHVVLLKDITNYKPN